MRVFVIWDLTSSAVRTLLEALPELIPTYGEVAVTWHIPSATVAGRQLARDVIARGIADADHVIALLDKPSASVGWQVGLAIGSQRSLQLAFLGAALPAWTQVGVLKGLFAHHLGDVTGIRQLLAQQLWEMPAIPAQDQVGAPLILCPSGPVGSTLREVALQDLGARTLLEDGWGLYELPALLAGCRQLVWILSNDVREGADSAANGVVAGFAEACGLAVAVLRADDFPPVVDVQPRELRFRGLSEFKQKLQLVAAGGSVGKAQPGPRGEPARRGTVADGSTLPKTEGSPVASRRERLAWLALVIAVGAVGTIGGGLGWKRLRQPPPTTTTSVIAAPVPTAPAAPQQVVAPATPPPAAKPPAVAASERHRHNPKGPQRPPREMQPWVTPQTTPWTTESPESIPLDPNPPRWTVIQQPSPDPTTPEPVRRRPAPERQPDPEPAAPRHKAMESERFAKLRSRVATTVSSEARMGIVRDAVSDGNYFSCEQIAQVMKTVVSSQLQIQMAAILYEHVVDPENTSDIMAALFHEMDRQQLRTLLHRSE